MDKKALKKQQKGEAKERKATIKRQATAEKLRLKAEKEELKRQASLAKLREKEMKKAAKEEKKAVRRNTIAAKKEERAEKAARRKSVSGMLRPSSKGSSKESLKSIGSETAMSVTSDSASPPRGETQTANLSKPVAKEAKSGSYAPATRKASGAYGFGDDAGAVENTGSYRPKKTSENVLPPKSMTHFAKKPIEKGSFGPPPTSGLSLDDATKKAQDSARQRAEKRTADLEAEHDKAEKQREQAKLAAARRAAAKAAGDFMTQTGKSEPAPRGGGARRGLPMGLNLGGGGGEADSDTDSPMLPRRTTGLRGLPMGAMDDDDDAADGPPAADGPAEAAADLSFEEIMNKAMELEQQQAGGDAGGPAESAEPEKPPEDWEVWRAVSEKDAEEIEALGECGANFDIRDGEDRTPLHKACDMECVEVVEALLKAGCDKNAKTGDGLDWTALHIAALSGYPDVLKVLLTAGCDTGALDSRKETPLQWAEANSEEECVKLLKEHMGL